jgi:PBP1b-binding outer membrane lipoprotein LpoB
MRLVFASLCAVLLAGCVTEPAPSEPKTYGQIVSPNKKMKLKPAKQKEAETTTTTVVE